MCGIVGCVDLRDERRVERNLLHRMTQKLAHRGPDASGYFFEEHVGLGFRRLSIIDLEGGNQPMYNEDGSLVLICNGEIFNYRELRSLLETKGHVFRTDSDVEVVLHLYEEDGIELLHSLNGQFAFAIYERESARLFLARDQFGISPLYYSLVDDMFVFASEIKAILEHPRCSREVDLTGLDQILSFPGLISPRTMFKGIKSLKNGHYIVVADSNVCVNEYWDLDYPRTGDVSCDIPESHQIGQLKELLARSIQYRLHADVPVGFYLSGGLDSSLMAAMIKAVSPDVRRHSFSVAFSDHEIDESRFRELVVPHLPTVHHEIPFGWAEIAERMTDTVYHCECPLKETYNTCSLVLSEHARDSGVAVILSGEGADELFGGYLGYRFDQLGARRVQETGLTAVLEAEIRERLWGDRRLFYEKDQYAFRDTKTALYSAKLRRRFRSFDCLNHPIVDRTKLEGRDIVHQRSYLDFKLRLVDHLLADHGDRMLLANSVEGRYPFLDIDLVDYVTRIPPALKVNRFREKHILRELAAGIVPRAIVEREKFGFRAPSSPTLMQQSIEWINDVLSYERISREGYFDPDTVEKLKSRYSSNDFSLHPHLQDDLLLVVLTFGLFLELFDMPSV